MKTWQKVLLGLVIITALGILSIFNYFKGTYNSMVKLEESVTASWSQVENVYQRRYDLIPNLVNTVKGYAAHENETFTAVTEARAKVGGVMNMSPEMMNDPAMLEKFQKAQQGLSGALQRLMVVQERYPELKANQNFLALQSQLEGTENRIAVERKRFNEAAQSFNTLIRLFPKNIIANISGFRAKTYFKADVAAQAAPKVEF
jgi:LemA protein